MNDVVQHINKSAEPVIFSETAIRHVLSYLKKSNSKGIRLSVKKTGCSGMSYVIDYIEKPSTNDITLSLADDYLICIDKSSYPYIKGMNVDYVKEGLNQKFIFQNPNQTGQCGCGESFTVD